MLEAVVFIFSIVLLVKGSDVLADSAAKTAKIFGVSDFVIGVTIIAIGTSLPELASGIYASYIYEGDIVIGDVLGSNITNIALVLGLTCLVKPLTVKHTEIYSGWLHLMILTFASAVLLAGSGLARIGGAIFLLVYVLYLRKVIREYQTVGMKPVPRNSLIKNAVRLCLGLVGVLIGAKLLVGSILSFARIFDIPEYTISLLLMALGTSLPEVFTATAAAKKGYSTMALGNIIGSNIANILLVMGTAALVRPLHMDVKQMVPAVITMMLFSVFLVRFKRSQYTIDRKEGFVFVVLYLVFVWLSLAVL
jgi:cation:H+ antiporter